MNATTRPLIAHVVHRLDVGGLENGVVNLVNRMPAASFRQAIVCLAAHFYHHRDDMASIPGVVETMLAPYRPLGIA